MSGQGLCNAWLALGLALAGHWPGPWPGPAWPCLAGPILSLELLELVSCQVKGPSGRASLWVPPPARVGK